MATKLSYYQPLNVSCIVSASIKPKIRDSVFYMITRNSIVSTNDILCREQKLSLSGIIFHIAFYWTITITNGREKILKGEKKKWK